MTSNDTTVVGELSIIDQKSAILESRGTNCMCDDRQNDEEEKENMIAEIHLTYEEILQLE